MNPADRVVLTAALPPSASRDAALVAAVGAAPEWARVERHATDWGLAPLVARGLASASPGAPPPLVARLREIETLTAVRNALLLHHLAAIERLVGGAATLVVLKGADLMRSVYPAVGCRVSMDLDLLAAAADVPSIEARLAAAGWSRRIEVDADWFEEHLHHGNPWTSPDGAIVLELHWDLVRPDDPFRFSDGATIVRRSRPSALATPAARRLDPLDQVTFLAAHAVRHLDAPEAAFRSLIDLAWFLDREGDPLSAAAIVAAGRATATLAPLAAAFAFLRDLGAGRGMPDPAVVDGALSPAERPLAARITAMVTALPERPVFRPLAVATGVSGFAQRSGGARWRFLARGLFPRPGDVNRDLTRNQSRRPLPIRYLSLGWNYLGEALKLGPSGLSAAARIGRLRRDLARERDRHGSAMMPRGSGKAERPS